MSLLVFVGDGVLHQVASLPIITQVMEKHVHELRRNAFKPVVICQLVNEVRTKFIGLERIDSIGSWWPHPNNTWWADNMSTAFIHFQDNYPTTKIDSASFSITADPCACHHDWSMPLLITFDLHKGIKTQFSQGYQSALKLKQHHWKRFEPQYFSPPYVLLTWLAAKLKFKQTQEGSCIHIPVDQQLLSQQLIQSTKEGQQARRMLATVAQQAVVESDKLRQLCDDSISQQKSEHQQLQLENSTLQSLVEVAQQQLKEVQKAHKLDLIQVTQSHKNELALVKATKKKQGKPKAIQPSAAQTSISKQVMNRTQLDVTGKEFDHSNRTQLDVDVTHEVFDHSSQLNFESPEGRATTHASTVMYPVVDVPSFINMEPSTVRNDMLSTGVGSTVASPQTPSSKTPVKNNVLKRSHQNMGNGGGNVYARQYVTQSLSRSSRK